MLPHAKYPCATSCNCHTNVDYIPDLFNLKNTYISQFIQHESCLVVFFLHYIPAIIVVVLTSVRIKRINPSVPLWFTTSLKSYNTVCQRCEPLSKIICCTKTFRFDSSDAVNLPISAIETVENGGYEGGCSVLFWRIHTTERGWLGTTYSLCVLL